MSERIVRMVGFLVLAHAIPLTYTAWWPNSRIMMVAGVILVISEALGIYTEVKR